MTAPSRAEEKSRPKGRSTSITVGSSSGSLEPGEVTGGMSPGGASSASKSDYLI